MDATHLVAHVVRGEVTFDVAHQVEVDEETVWITSTYGHLAHPIATWLLLDLYIPTTDAGYDYKPLDLPEVPTTYIDHFPPKASKVPVSGISLLATLGLTPKAPTIKRRF